MPLNLIINFSPSHAAWDVRPLGRPVTTVRCLESSVGVQLREQKPAVPSGTPWRNAHHRQAGNFVTSKLCIHPGVKVDDFMAKIRKVEKSIRSQDNIIAAVNLKRSVILLAVILVTQYGLPH